MPTTSSWPIYWGAIAFPVVTGYQDVSSSPISDGQPLSTVNIVGANFGSVTGTVTFSGVSPTLTSWTDTKITAAVPAVGSYPFTAPFVIHPALSAIGANLGNARGPVFTIDSPYFNKGANFNRGLGCEISVAHSPLYDPNSAFTLASWVNPASLAAVAQTYITKENGQVGQWILGVDVNTGKFYINLTTNNAVATTYSAKVSGTVNVWQLLVCTWDGSTLKISVNNGTAVSTATLGTASGDTGSLHLGCDPNTATTPCSGSLDEVAFWGRVLSSGEITNLYNGGTGINYYDVAATYTSLLTGLSFWYELNDTTWIDSSINGLNLSAGAPAPTIVSGVR